MIDAAQKEGRDLFDRKYRKTDEELGEAVHMASVALEEAMDCCRAQLLPLKKQRQEVMEKLYSLTKDAAYSTSPTVPFEASSLYFDLSERIVDFELELD